MSQPNPVVTHPLILILEDDNSMRECFSALFEFLGYTVAAGGNGFDGVYTLQKLYRLSKVPDLILTDVVMDGMDGLQFLKTVQAEPQWRDIPVVLVSGMVDSFSRMARVNGVLKSAKVTFIPKPFEIQNLLAAIQRVTRLPAVPASAV